MQVASHIVPWAEDRRNRLNPHNGLCLSAPHDRAFDQGLITITPGSLRVRVSERLRDTVRRVRSCLLPTQAAHRPHVVDQPPKPPGQQPTVSYVVAIGA